MSYRSEAKKTGETYYFTNKPCKYGHVSKRQTSNGTCVECNRNISLAHYRRNSEDRIKSVTRYRALNPDKTKKWSKTGYENNKAGFCSRAIARHAAKLQRTPPWISSLERKEILDFYKERDRLSELTGVSFHVDHIVPLQGERVSGLHVPWNLQILTAFDNISKSNKFTPGYV